MEEPLAKVATIPKSQQYYLGHLAAVNETRRVYADCALIAPGGHQVREGQRMNPEMVNALKQVNLGTSLLQVFSIEAGLDKEGLYDALVNYLQVDPSLKEMYSNFHLPILIEGFCREACKEPTVTQLLTVLQARYPKIFEQALFCAWFSVLALRDQTTEDELFELFYAGLLHDVGVLFVHPSAVENDNRTTSEWLEYYSHPKVACELIEQLPTMPYATLRAVAEHHERLDGSGYPASRVAKQLNWRGQLIQLLDSCYAVYSRHFKCRGRTLPDIIPIIQMNAPTRADRAANALIMALKVGSGTEKCGVPNALMPDLIGCVRERHVYIKTVLDLGLALNDSVGMVLSNTRMFSLQKTLEHIDVAMKQSGLINDAYMRWLALVEKEKLAHAYREVEDVFLMMQEVIYHIGRYKTQLFVSLDAPSACKFKSQFQEILTNLNELDVPVIPESIVNVWQEQPIKVSETSD